jgi:hypothetical protein
VSTLIARCGNCPRTTDLLGGVDGVAVAGLHAADVDDPGAFVDDASDPIEGGALVEGGARIVERVRGAVHDRHHGVLVVVE